MWSVGWGESTSGEGIVIFHVHTAGLHRHPMASAEIWHHIGCCCTHIQIRHQIYRAELCSRGAESHDRSEMNKHLNVPQFCHKGQVLPCWHELGDTVLAAVRTVRTLKDNPKHPLSAGKTHWHRIHAIYFHRATDTPPSTVVYQRPRVYSPVSSGILSRNVSEEIRTSGPLMAKMSSCFYHRQSLQFRGPWSWQAVAAPGVRVYLSQTGKVYDF